MFQPADYKLSDMLGVAGATIGIIIAAGVLLQMLSTRYIAVFDRYRALTGERRGNPGNNSRHGSLGEQIVSYRKQIVALNTGSMCVSLAVLAFLLTVGVASLSVIFPELLALRLLGTAALFSGLGLIFAGVVCLLRETLVQRPAIGSEVADIGDLPSGREAVAR